MLLRWKIIGAGTRGARKQSIEFYRLRRNHSFREVLSFHDGIAAVVDKRGHAYHVTSDWKPLYDQRFRRTFGFYAAKRAAVVAADPLGSCGPNTEHWFHIDQSGNPAYPERYAWCGNFAAIKDNGISQDPASLSAGGEQSSLAQAPVRTHSQEYYLIDEAGNRRSGPWLYAGDANSSGESVVWKRNGSCAIINSDGTDWCKDLASSAEWIEAGVPHKGVAAVRDRDGWFYVLQSGRQFGKGRYQFVEPHYNAQARVRLLSGAWAVIDEQGEVLLDIQEGDLSCAVELENTAKLYWKSLALKAVIENESLLRNPRQITNSEGGAHVLREVLLNVAEELGLYRARAPPADTIDERSVVEDSLTKRGKMLFDEGAVASARARYWTQDRYIDAWARGVHGEMPPEDTFSVLAKDAKSVALSQKVLQSYAARDWSGIVPFLPLDTVCSSSSRPKRDGNATVRDQHTDIRVVDLGGGRGSLLKEIARATMLEPSNLICFDRPEVCSLALSSSAPSPTVSAEIKENQQGSAFAVPGVLQQEEAEICFQAGDLFTSSLPSADLYLMSRVLHDWDDGKAARILQRLWKDCPNHAKLCVIDREVTMDNRHGMLSLHMYMLQRSYERSAEQWNALFERNHWKVESKVPFNGHMVFTLTKVVAGNPFADEFSTARASSIFTAAPLSAPLASLIDSAIHRSDPGNSSQPGIQSGYPAHVSALLPAPTHTFIRSADGTRCEVSANRESERGRERRVGKGRAKDRGGRVRKCVVPIAGLGTRMAPMSGILPKAFLPIVVAASPSDSSPALVSAAAADALHIRGSAGEGKDAVVADTRSDAVATTLRAASATTPGARKHVYPALTLLLDQLFSSESIVEVCLVVSPSQRPIVDQYLASLRDPSHIFSSSSSATATAALSILHRRVSEGCVSVVEQRIARGFGDAILCARDFVGSKDPFLVALGDHVFSQGCVDQLLRTYSALADQLDQLEEVDEVDEVRGFALTGTAVCALHEVPHTGLLRPHLHLGSPRIGTAWQVDSMVEKPKTGISEYLHDSGGYISQLGLEVLPASIFQDLAADLTTLPATEELCIRAVVQKHLLQARGRGLYAVLVDGERLDIGIPESYAQTVHRIACADQSIVRVGDKSDGFGDNPRRDGVQAVSAPSVQSEPSSSLYQDRSDTVDASKIDSDMASVLGAVARTLLSAPTVDPAITAALAPFLLSQTTAVPQEGMRLNEFSMPRMDVEVHLASAPGRMDLMGGFADYSGSLALQYPTQMRTVAALGVCKNTDNRIAAAAEKAEAEAERGVQGVEGGETRIIERERASNKASSDEDRRRIRLVSIRVPSLDPTRMAALSLSPADPAASSSAATFPLGIMFRGGDGSDGGVLGDLVSPHELRERVLVAMKQQTIGRRQGQRHVLGRSSCAHPSEASEEECAQAVTWPLHAIGSLHAMFAASVSMQAGASGNQGALDFHPALDGDIMLITMSDLPWNAGLASSAAVEVAVALAAGHALRVSPLLLQPTALSVLCQAVEHEVVGAQCGLMDQLTVTHPLLARPTCAGWPALVGVRCGDIVRKDILRSSLHSNVDPAGGTPAAPLAASECRTPFVSLGHTNSDGGPQKDADALAIDPQKVGMDLQLTYTMPFAEDLSLVALESGKRRSTASRQYRRVRTASLIGRDMLKAHIKSIDHVNSTVTRSRGRGAYCGEMDQLCDISPSMFQEWSCILPISITRKELLSSRHASVLSEETRRALDLDISIELSQQGSHEQQGDRESEKETYITMMGEKIHCNTRKSSRGPEAEDKGRRREEGELSLEGEGIVYPVRSATAHPIEENFRTKLVESALRHYASTQCSQRSPLSRDGGSKTDRKGETAALLDHIGELMAQSHASYSACGLGSAETDALVRAVLSHGNGGSSEIHVIGAKISGGGGGGTVTALVRYPSNAQSAISGMSGFADRAEFWAGVQDRYFAETGFRCVVREDRGTERTMRYHGILPGL